MKKLTTIILIILVFVSTLFSLDVKITKSGLIYSNHICYDLGYSYEHNMALWSKYTLDSEKLENVVPRPKRRFILDENLPKRTITHNDYTKSGYDRGHLTPVDDLQYSYESASSTFVITNVVPMEKSFNRGIWQRLENYVSDFIEKYYEAVIVTGPIFEGNLSYMGKDFNIPIPTSFYKLLVSDKCTEVYIVPHKNSSDDLSTFKSDLETLQKKTGIEFQIIY